MRVRMTDNERDDSRRPDPDALLALAEKDRRGKLTVFLGAAPGVGKTYAMLSRARRLKAEGVDVVAGVVVMVLSFAARVAATVRITWTPVRFARTFIRAPRTPVRVGRVVVRRVRPTVRVGGTVVRFSRTVVPMSRTGGRAGRTIGRTVRSVAAFCASFGHRVSRR